MQFPQFASEIDDGFALLIDETSPLHDIGKVGIPDAILLKPGRLTEEEFAIMQTHTTIGAATLDAALAKFPDARFLMFARDIVACHHEHYDGSGYPRGLKGDEIPLCARIVAVADVYDACSTHRVYRPAMSHQQDVELIRNGAGTHFDPPVVQAFLQVADEFARICRDLADDKASPSADLSTPATVVTPAAALAAMSTPPTAVPV
jgi:putative two-component system response regulator